MPVSPFVNRREILAAAGCSFAPMLLGIGPSSAAVGRSKNESLLQQLIDAQSSSGAPVVIPPGPNPIPVTGPVYVPAGTTLVIQRDLAGAPWASLVLEGHTSLHFEGAHVRNVPIKARSGTISITGLDYSGRAHTAAIVIDGPGPYTDLHISDFRITDANFGILRQGRYSTLVGATISGGKFRNLAGDPVEWNVCPYDVGVIIEDLDIQGVVGPPDKPAWGIGVGVAGGLYSPTWEPAVSARDFTIRRIRGRSLAQLIHVEKGIGFTIEDITGQDIASRDGTKNFTQNGLETASVVCYGCRNFSVRGVNADARILLISGVIESRYIVPCSDFELANVHLARGDIVLDVGGSHSYARLRHIRLEAGSLRIAGAAQHLELADVDIVSPDNKTEPLVSNPHFLTGPLARFAPAMPLEYRENVRLLRRGIGQGNP